MPGINGIMGQLIGPFSANQNVIPLIASKEGVTSPIFFKLGISIGEKDYMIYTRETVETYIDPKEHKEYKKINVEKQFTFELGQNNAEPEEFWLGKTQIYESDDGLTISHLSFPEGAPASTLIEYTILSRD